MILYWIAFERGRRGPGVLERREWRHGALGGAPGIASRWGVDPTVYGGGGAVRGVGGEVAGSSDG